MGYERKAFDDIDDPKLNPDVANLLIGLLAIVAIVFAFWASFH